MNVARSTIETVQRSKHASWGPLRTDARTALFYAAAHSGVIYDCATRTQRPSDDRDIT